MTPPTRLALAPDEFTGRKLGKYEVLCRLSMGGMSELFLALQQGAAGFRKLVVLKQILPDVSDDPDFVRRFIREARVMALFSHPHIAQVYDLDQVNAEYFLAMEFVAGATLLELANACLKADDEVPLGLALGVVRDVAHALHSAHTFVDPAGKARPVIHRDIAPKNVMLTFGGTTKLLDFGIAKAEGHANRTQVGTTLGTPGYMSPEQATARPLDGRSDVFSLGVVLHECLVGARLFTATPHENERQAVLNRPVPAPSVSRPGVSPQLDAVVLKALARRPEDRFANALELARALEGLGEGVIWSAEQRGALVKRFFGDRQEQVQQLLQAVEGGSPTSIFQRPELTPTTRTDIPAVPARPGELPIGTQPLPVPPTITQTHPDRPRQSRVRGWTWAAAATGAIALGALTWLSLGRSGTVDPIGPVVTPVSTDSPGLHPGGSPPAPAEVTSAGPPPAPDPGALPPAPEPSPVARVPAPPVAAIPRSPHPGPARASRPPAAEPGSLWIKVRPWARVFVDGKLRGETPLQPFTLAAGRHEVVLVNDQLKVRQTHAIEVEPRQQRELKVSLE